jgi:subtilase family serine protease
MRSPGTAGILTGMLLFCFPVFAQTQASRISQPIDSRRMVAVSGNVPPQARPEFDQGALDPSQMLNRVTIFFQRTAAQQQALDKFLQEQQDPASSNYQKWLTPQQFAAQFGLSDADLNKVKDWLTSQGFTITDVAQGHGWITFSGSAGQISAALQTELHQYEVNGELHYANGTPPAIPSALSGVVAGFRSLNDFRPHRRASFHRVKPNFTSSVSGNHYVAPDDLTRIYNLTGLYSSGIDGTGQKLAVMGQTDIKLADIATFRSVSGLPANVPQVILVPGSTDPGVVTGDLSEADLDVEWSGAVARNAQIIYVNSGNGAIDSLQYAVDQNVAPVLSISYGDCEPHFQPSDFTFFITLGQQANAQGQTIVAPSGDDGAADCDYSTNSTPVTIASKGLAVDVPAALPYVTGVGGTTFNEGTGTYWTTVNNSSSGSALYYIPETSWNDTTFEIANGGSLSASGGGASTQFAKPSWQAGVGVPNDGARDVPDIAFNASIDHDGFIICSNGDCINGYRYTDSTLEVVGGTSVGVPVFAGIVTLLNQKINASQGNVNPRLYALSASVPYVFHDVSSGDNKVPCLAGSPNCPNGGMIGFTAGTGYDQVTGLGSVDAYSMVSNWSSPASADFGLTFFDNTGITMTRGGTAAMPVILQRFNGFNGTVALTCTIATVTNATCSVTPNSVNPDGAVTLTITTTALASLRPPGSGSPFMPWWEPAFGVAAFLSIGNNQRGKKNVALLALLMLVLVFAFVSCGGGGSSTSSNSSSSSGSLPAQMGTVTVTATSGTLSHSAQLNLTVN